MRKHLPLFFVLLLSIVVHTAYFTHPRETVFDEVHFGKFVSAYFTGEYYFDIHPPLGKLIISGAGYLAGFQPGFSFGQIGDQFPDTTYLAMRMLPRIAGILLPLVIMLLVLQLGFSRLAATSAGLLIVFENALLVQSRFMLLDAFLLLFGFTAWWLYAKSRSTLTLHATRYMFCAAVFAGAAASVKWTGITFLGIIGILEIIRLVRERTRFASLAMLAVVPFLVYYALFTVHFSLLPKPGQGDAFMTQEFRDGKLSTFEKFIELNKQMYDANARLTATHPYASAWYTWPLMQRPIYYWNEDTAKIYLLGNPVVWWASTVGILYLLIISVLTRNRLGLAIVGAYLVNLLPFIGIHRAMFLYHYFVALIIAIIALVYAIDQQEAKTRRNIFAGLIIASIAAFLLYAPLSYGLEAPYLQSLMLRTWQ